MLTRLTEMDIKSAQRHQVTKKKRRKVTKKPKLSKKARAKSLEKIKQEAIIKNLLDDLKFRKYGMRVHRDETELNSILDNVANADSQYYIQVNITSNQIVNLKFFIYLNRLSLDNCI